MQRTRFGDMACSIARAMDVIGEPWSPLILRNVYVGINRFEQMQETLGHLAQGAHRTAEVADRAGRATETQTTSNRSPHSTISDASTRSKRGTSYASAAAVTAGPCGRRRAKTTPTSTSAITETITGPTAPVPKIRVTPYVAAPITAAAGSVSTHATTMLPGDAPADGREPLAGARAHDGAGDRVRRRQRVADVRGGEDDGGAGALGGEALGGVHLDDARPIVLMIRQPPM